MLKTQRRAAASAVAAIALVTHLGGVAAADGGEPPYNQDGLTASFQVNCYPVSVDGDELGDPSDPDNVANLKRDWSSLLSAVGGGPGDSTPRAATVDVTVGVGDVKLPANPMPGEVYAAALDIDIAVTLPPGARAMAQAVAGEPTISLTARPTLVFGTATGERSVRHTLTSQAEPVPASASTPVAFEINEVPDIAVPADWNQSTFDVIFSGDSAITLEYSGDGAMTWTEDCFVQDDPTSDVSETATVGSVLGNYTPPPPPVVCDNNDGVMPTAGNDESAAFYRFASKNRVLTALYAAKNTSGWCDTAILASSVDYADALAAAPLADALDAPILLANADGSLDPQVQEYLASEFDFVVIASGPGVIPESVRNSLNDALTAMDVDNTYGGVHTARVAGVNRYETAATLAVATLVAEGGKDDWTSGAQFILADGQNFPDALAAGPAAAAATNGVILLTAGDSGVPSFTSMFLPGQSISFSGATLAYLPGWIPGWPTTTFDWSAIGNFDHQTITVVGGAAKAAAEAGMLGNITEPVEYDDALVGADRYETATLVATKYFGSEPTYYTLASGEDFPDAVVAGGWAANADGPLVLTRNAALPQVTMDYLVDVADNGDAFVVFGGTGSVSMNVSDQLEDTFIW